MMDETAIFTAAEATEAEALAYLHEVHMDPDTAVTEIPDAIARSPDTKSPARWAYERLILYIQNFEEKLDNEHEVAMGFVGGEAGILRIEGLGYFDPDLVTFYGTDATGARTQLIQHVTQLSVMLRALPKRAMDAAPRRIGFRLARGLAPSAEAGDAPPPATG